MTTTTTTSNRRTVIRDDDDNEGRIIEMRLYVEKPEPIMGDAIIAWVNDLPCVGPIRIASGGPKRGKYLVWRRPRV